MTDPTTPAEPTWSIDGYGYPDLIAEARASVRADGGFVDPRKIRTYEGLRHPADWRIAVLGHHPAPTLVEMHALLIADRRELDPPLPAWLAERREREAANRAAAEQLATARIAALDAEWEALREALGVPTKVQYNYSGPRHLEMYSSGADHIILVEPLDRGRLHRPAGYALCSVPSNRDHQLFPFAAWPADGTHGDDDRLPSCKACLRIACRVTGVAAPLLLTHRKAGRK